ncbi:LOW QUALITY PROTEIN: urea transporter 1-like [Betta splendens]|uniref:LOW QUALITY PROTEIN: urea transporter 1-like n=1 Tax=Betta splendens TaxID=158456 RepID=A0A8M1HKH0_BETSP|nr:LOW QUALITY PROTEIN: urea transporter 1-like [Betta splendens]
MLPAELEDQELQHKHTQACMRRTVTEDVDDMDNNNLPACEEALAPTPTPTPAPAQPCLRRAVQLFSGDMRLCGQWVKRRVAAVQLVDWTLRGVAQVMFVNNPVSGLLITAGLFLQDPWWAANGLLGTLVSTVSAVLLRQNREAISAGLYGYNGTLVGVLMAAFSASGSWYWWLLLPNIFMSMMCPVLSSALASVAATWDLPIFTLPFNILVCLHVAATGAAHPFFPEVSIQPNLSSPNGSVADLSISQLLLSVPAGVGQVFGCDGPWTGGLVLLALLLCSPTICLHALVGSAAGALSGLALAASHRDVYSGLWGFNSALSCVAVGGVFYVLTWQTHLLALTCALFCAYMTAAVSKSMSVLALPACTWPFCLSTLIFLLISSETPAICRLPLSVVSYPEENLRYQRQLKASEKAQQRQHGGGQEEAPLKESGESKSQPAGERRCSESG